MYFGVKVQVFVYMFLLQGIILHSQPRIISFSPLNGPVGSTVIITGTNFSPIPANNIVHFGGAKAIITGASANTLTVIVPPGITSSPITVVSNNLIAYAALRFQVTFPRGGMYFGSNFLAPRVSKKATFRIRNLSLVDFNDDGKLDVLTIQPGQGNGVNIFENTSTPGNISFASPVIIPGLQLWHSFTGDFNNDGRIDIGVMRDYGLIDSLIIYLRSGPPNSFTFTNAGTFTAGRSPTTIKVADIDGDGRIDLVTGCNSGFDVDDTTWIYRNTGNTSTLSFAPPIPLACYDGLTQIALNDLDADGKSEIIVVNALNKLSRVSVFKNSSIPGILSFEPRIDYLGNNGIMNLDVGDITDDGMPDIITSGGGLYENPMVRNTTASGILSFDNQVQFIDFISQDSHISDINGDGKPDMVSNTLFGPVVINRNICTSEEIVLDKISFEYPAVQGTSSAKVGDIDMDGRLDIVGVNIFDSTFSVFRNMSPSCHLLVDQFPYRESFEDTDGSWFGGGDESDWRWGKPSKIGLDNAASGYGAWMTGKTNGTYLRNQVSWLRSPCFDFSTLQNPQISFKAWWETERQRDGANLQYSIDSGLTWINLGESSSNVPCKIVNWYSQSNVTALGGPGWSGSRSNASTCGSGDGSGGWLPVRHDLTFLAGQPKVIFRFGFASDGDCSDHEGFAVDEIVISEPLKPIVTLGNDTTLCPGSTLILDAGPYAGYLWNGTINTRTLQVTQEGDYTLMVTDSFGCQASDTIKITLKCNGIYFPKAFTPNGDSRNDLFGPVGDAQSVSKFILEVYDRYGRRVFRSTDPLQKWNGILGDRKLSTQVLVWQAAYELDGKSYKVSGTTTLIR